MRSNNSNRGCKKKACRLCCRIFKYSCKICGLVVPLFSLLVLYELHLQMNYERDISFISPQFEKILNMSYEVGVPQPSCHYDHHLLTNNKLLPEERQSTVHDTNYSTTNRGNFSTGQWRTNREPCDTPPLFMDRLNHYLPECPPLRGPPTNGSTTPTPCDNNHTRLFPEDVEAMEKEILNFHIPRKIVIVFPENAEYVSLQNWRWNMLIDALNHTAGTRKMCPNCHIRYSKPPFHKPNLTQEPAHVRIYPGCDSYRFDGRLQNDTGRDFPDQVLIGECGESQIGTGYSYWAEGLRKFDYDMSFVPLKDSPFVRTYAFLHLSPDQVYHYNGSHLRPLHNVTDFVKQLLTTPVPSFPRHVHNPAVQERLRQVNRTTATLQQAAQNYDVSWIHNNCIGIRGVFVRTMMKAMALNTTNMTIAGYGACFHNIESEQVMGGGWDDKCKEEQGDFLHGDCEGHRDASKTILASHHKFGFALENTQSPYYFTEKRWQVLLAASVPVVWDNHNSLQYLPDPDAALLVSNWQSDAEETAQAIHYYAQPENEQEYLDKFFAWKRRGLRPDFVRKLFLSSDFVLCRICEHMAHHHFYEEEDDEE